MKKLPIKRCLTAAAIFTLANSHAESQPAAVSGAGEVQAVSGAAKSKHFDAVASRLNLGGEVFGYIDVDGDVEKLAGIIRGMLDKIPAGEMPPHIAKLDLTKVLSDIGLDGIEAMGMSSYKNGDLYHNRAFLYLPEGRKGALKVFGGEAGAFLSSTLAPADSDVIVEQTLDVASVYEVMSKLAMHFGGEDGYAEFRREMSQKNPRLGMPMSELLGRINTRVTLIGRIHPDKPLELPDAPFKVPSFDAMVVLDDMSWLYEKMTAQVKEEMPPDQVAQMFVKGEGSEKIVLPPMPSPDMSIVQPVIMHDLASKRVYIATTQAFLDECFSGKSKITDSPEFQAINAGLPTKGNGRSYVSSEVMKTIRDLVAEAKKAAEAESGRLGAMEMMLLLLPQSVSAQAKVTVNQKDGIFVTSNSTASIKEGVIMGGVATMAVFGGVSYRFRSMSPPRNATPAEPGELFPE